MFGFTFFYFMLDLQGLRGKLGKTQIKYLEENQSCHKGLCLFIFLWVRNLRKSPITYLVSLLKMIGRAKTVVQCGKKLSIQV